VRVEAALPHADLGGQAADRLYAIRVEWELVRMGKIKQMRVFFDAPRFAAMFEQR
jgi:hypothetical protein